MAEGDSILRVARRMDAALAGSQVSVRTPGRRRPDGLPPTSIDGLRARASREPRQTPAAALRGKPRPSQPPRHARRVAALPHGGALAATGPATPGSRWRATSRRPSTSAARSCGSSPRAQLEPRSAVGATRSRHTRRGLRAGCGDSQDARDESADRAGRGAARPEAGGGHRQHLQVGGVLRGGGRSHRSASDRSMTSELADVLGATRPPDARGRRIRAAAEAGLPAGGRTCPRCGAAIRARAQGDGARTTYWCPGCQTG